MSRRRFPLHVREAVVADAAEIGISAASAKWGVGRSNIYRWTAQLSGRPSIAKGTPLRDACNAIVERVAAEAGVSVADLSASHRADLKLVRAIAWHEIIRETSCTRQELARVWGCSPNTITRGLGLRASESKHLLRMLSWHHGSGRALAIVNDRDPAANADLASWTFLGQRRAA